MTQKAFDKIAAGLREALEVAKGDTAVVQDRVVQVGDHQAEVVRIHPERAAELHAIRATSWSAEEYRDLAVRFADAASLLKIAINNENFAGIRSASLTLDEIAAQTAFLNDGLRHAIENAMQAAQQKVYRR